MAEAQRYECSKCRYKFTPKSGNVPERCPYCSNLTVRKVAKAQELINSALNKEFNF